MKILIKNDIISGGGVEIVMRDLVKYLAQIGDDVTVVVDDGNKKEFYKYYPKNTKLLSRCYDGIKRKDPISRLVNSFISKKYRKDYLKGIKQSFDVAIAIKDGPSMKYVADEIVATKKIAWVHADYDYCHWSKTWFNNSEDERKYMAGFDQIVCVSEAVKKSVLKNVGELDNLCVCLNPLDAFGIAKKANEQISEKKPNGKLLFVSVGRLSEQKNYLQLIDAVCLIDEKIRDSFEIWIIGDGEQRSNIESKLKENNISCIKLLGWKTNPYPYIKIADCFLSTAIWESFGLAIQESLILEVPVISTWWPALDEVFDARFGIISKCDKNQIAKDISYIIENRESLVEYKNNIQRYFSIDNIWKDRLETIYDLINKTSI